MSILTRFSGLRILFIGIFLLILINLLINYARVRYDNSTILESYRRVHKYARMFGGNHSKILHAEEATFNENETQKSQDYIKSAKLLNTVPIDANVSLPICQQLNYESEGGPITPNVTLISLEVVENELGALLHSGGSYHPKHCNATDHVAVVVPFRDRYAHLSVFLRNIHPFLMKQNISYRVFIIEQINGKPFNRASLMNIGILEALKLFPYDCFIFHDVDLLPLDTRNIYNCPNQPRHLSVAIDTLNFKLPYLTIFGGASAMSRQHVEKVNGFSNLYYGWGGEDDDMSNRISHSGLYIARYPSNIARYTMLKHQKEKANPLRYENLANSHMEKDGLNTIKYNIYSFKEFPTFTWYLVELTAPFGKKAEGKQF